MCIHVHDDAKRDLSYSVNFGFSILTNKTLMSLKRVGLYILIEPVVFYHKKMLIFAITINTQNNLRFLFIAE